MEISELKNKILSKNNFKISVFSAIISLIIIPSITYHCSNIITRLINGKIIRYFFLFLIIFLIILFIITMLCNIKIKFNATKVSKANILLYAFPCIFVWEIYQIAFYPAFMSTDSFVQWQQAHTYVFNDWHPVMHTLFILAITKIWDAPQAVVLVQILLISFTVGYGLYSVERTGISKKILIVISLLFALFPTNAVMSISIWKDTMYNCCLSAFTIMVINIFFTKGEWIDSPLNMSSFTLIALCVIFFRHNGILPLFGTIILLLLIYREKIKKFLLIFFTIAMIFILVKFPLYHILKVTPGPSSEAFGIPIQQIAAVVKADGYLTNEQKQKINKIMPMKSMSNNYFPYSTNNIKFQNDYNSNIIEQDKIGFLKLWLSVCIQNPKTVVKAYLAQTSIIWQLDEPADGGYTYITTMEINKNNFNITNKIINKKITDLCYRIINFSKTEKMMWLFWRPAFPFFIIIISGFILALKKGKKSLIMLSPVMLNILSLLMAIPAQDFRYLHANYLIAVIIFLAALNTKNYVQVNFYEKF